MTLMCDCMECVVPAADPDLVRTKVWMAAHWKMWLGPNRECHVVQVCPPGEARGSHYLRNRGLPLMLEVTYWPNPKHFRLTTGLDGKAELRYMQNLDKCEFAAIAARLNLQLDFAAKWVERWRAEAVRLANVNSAMRKIDGKPVIRKEGRTWRVRGMSRDGTYTSAQRKFRAWEDAVRFVAALKMGAREVDHQEVDHQEMDQGE